MSLRDDVIEAMSGIDELDDDFKRMMSKTPSGGKKFRQFMRNDAELKLDRLLDALADQASCSSYEATIRTHGRSPAVCSHTTLDGLIAVLRADYLTEEDR